MLEIFPTGEYQEYKLPWDVKDKLFLAFWVRCECLIVLLTNFDPPLPPLIYYSQYRGESFLHVARGF